MANPILFPSLSESSWLTSTNQITDALFSQYLESDYSQTELYKDQVASFAYVLAQNGKDETKLLTSVQSSLQIYFGRYFDSVVAEVNVTTDPQDPGKLVLTIFLSFTDSTGQEYNLNKIIRTSGNKVISVLNSNNFGT